MPLSLLLSSFSLLYKAHYFFKIYLIIFAFGYYFFLFFTSAFLFFILSILLCSLAFYLLASFFVFFLSSEFSESLLLSLLLLFCCCIYIILFAFDFFIINDYYCYNNNIVLFLCSSIISMLLNISFSLTLYICAREQIFCISMYTCLSVSIYDNRRIFKCVCVRGKGKVLIMYLQCEFIISFMCMKRNASFIHTMSFLIFPHLYKSTRDFIIFILNFIVLDLHYYIFI